MPKESCIFCKIINKTIPAKTVFEDKEVLAFEDIKPQAPVHILLVPKAHIEKISDLTDKDITIVGKLILAAKKLAKENGVEESGYRIVMNCNRDAGQEVFHLHAHLLGGRKFLWPPG